MELLLWTSMLIVAAGVVGCLIYLYRMDNHIRIIENIMASVVKQQDRNRSYNYTEYMDICNQLQSISNAVGVRKDFDHRYDDIFRKAVNNNFKIKESPYGGFEESN